MSREQFIDLSNFIDQQIARLPSQGIFVKCPGWHRVWLLKSEDQTPAVRKLLNDHYVLTTLGLLVPVIVLQSPWSLLALLLYIPLNILTLLRLNAALSSSQRSTVQQFMIAQARGKRQLLLQNYKKAQRLFLILAALFVWQFTSFYPSFLREATHQYELLSQLILCFAILSLGLRLRDLKGALEHGASPDRP